MVNIILNAKHPGSSVRGRRRGFFKCIVVSDIRTLYEKTQIVINKLVDV